VSGSRPNGSPTAEAREGTAGRLKNPARSTCPAHRHFGSATSRTRETDATADLASPEDDPGEGPLERLLTTERSRCAAPFEPPRQVNAHAADNVRAGGGGAPVSTCCEVAWEARIRFAGT
jgi:hypothetical protein